MQRRVRIILKSVHLELAWTEAAYDESSVAIRCAVQIALFVRFQTCSSDNDAVRVRMAVEIHVLRFVKRSLHGVVASGLIRRIPVRDRRTRNDMERSTFISKFRVTN